jgi:hypothetical protein
MAESPLWPDVPAGAQVADRMRVDRCRGRRDRIRVSGSWKEKSVAFPVDDESGALVSTVFFQELLSSVGVREYWVCGPETGHPSGIHEEFGGSEVPLFRRAFVEFLRPYTDRVFRLTANDFAVGDTGGQALPDVFLYRGVEVRLSLRRLQIITS